MSLWFKAPHARLFPLALLSAVVCAGSLTTAQAVPVPKPSPIAVLPQATSPKEEIAPAPARTQVETILPKAKPKVSVSPKRPTAKAVSKPRKQTKKHEGSGFSFPLFSGKQCSLQNQSVKIMPDVKGAGACGIKQPVKVDALKLDRGTLGLSMPIQANCGLVSAFDSWVQDDVLKIAKKQMGSELVGLKIAGSYSCRPRNNQRGAKLSEHGKGNAIDISGFVFKDGTVVSVKSGWKGKRKHRKFLQAVHKSACGTFSTVLGPNADRFHKDHFHLDLACHGKGCRVKICK